MLANVGAASPAPDTDRNEAILVAASLHAGRHQSDIVKYVSTHRAAREAPTNAFLSVSRAAASTDEDELAGLKACVGDFTHKARRTPRVIHPVAGAFCYTAYDCMKRRAMQYIAYRNGAPTDTRADHELTDWDDLARCAATRPPLPMRVPAPKR